MSTPESQKADIPPAESESAAVPQTEEEQRIVDLIKAGLQSGQPLPVDEAFFQRLLKRVPPGR